MWFLGLGSQKAVLLSFVPQKGSHQSLHSAEKVVVTENVALKRFEKPV